MSAAQTQKKWIVKDSEGRIKGPYTTDQVLSKIDKNQFMGGEQVAPYPGGDWIVMSKAPEFYDRLLDVLAAEAKGAGNFGGKQNPQVSIVTDHKTTANQTVGTNKSAYRQEPSMAVTDFSRSPVAQANEDDETDGGNDIVLKDLQAEENEEEIKKSKLPMIIIAVAVVVALGALMLPGGPGSIFEEHVHLLGPRKKQSTLSNAKVKDKFKRALGAFQLDTFAGYERAQSELVEAAEGASAKPEDARAKAEVLGFLCLTYRELWPFAYQDGHDFKVLTDVVQEARRIDPGGLHGSVCEIVNLVLNGKVREAQGLAASVQLESQAPVLFEIRGDLFMAAKDPTSAADYYNSGRKLWPGWQKVSVGEGRARAALKQFSEAEQLFRDVLAKVPDHGVAKVELGLIEALQFNQFDKGLSLLNSGVGSRIPRLILAKGYFGMAQIYEKKQQMSRATEVAQKAYALDPTNKEIQDFLGRHGGSGKVAPGETDLMYLGEEYMRGGDYFSAQAQFKAAFEANPKNGMAAMKAGKCLWKLNQSGDAIEWMRKAIMADHKLISAYVELADYYAQRFDFFPANEMLKKAQSLQPNNFEVFRGFALVALRRNDFKAADGYGARALKIYEADIDTLLLMAKANIGLLQYTEAQNYVGRAMDLDSSNVEALSLNAKITAAIHGVDAGARYVRDRLNQIVITQGHQIPQEAIDLRITLGEIYMQDERYRPAEEVIRQAVSLDPNSKRALVALAKSLQAQGLATQALEFFLKAAVMDPSDAEPLFFSGQLYASTRNWGEAYKQFERVLRVNPRFPKAHTALGRVSLSQGDNKKAIEEALLERQINPDLPDAYLLSAEAYFNLKQYSNCAGEYQKAISKHGQTAVTLVRMARCYRLTGALDSAQSLLHEATAIESGNPDIYKEQGAIFHTKALADEAIGAYDTYLRLAPNAIDRAEVESRIRKIQAGDMTFSD